jgi:hypothetical protein
MSQNIKTVLIVLAVIAAVGMVGPLNRALLTPRVG